MSKCVCVCVFMNLSFIHTYIHQLRYMEFRYGEMVVMNESTFPFDNFTLTAWRVRYKWDDNDKAQFISSSNMLNKVWNLCVNTIRITSLDTTTDSNTRERLPYVHTQTHTHIHTLDLTHNTHPI